MSTPLVGTSGTSPAKSADSQVLDNLRSFLQLNNQVPIENVCKSALYLLNHVPSARHAVFEYIATFYKVTFNIPKKSFDSINA
jgi:hypothetical protein